MISIDGLPRKAATRTRTARLGCAVRATGCS